MNAPAKLTWSESRFGPDTAHWLPRGPESLLDHIPGEDGLPVIGNTLEQLRDYPGFARRMVAKYGRGRTMLAENLPIVSSTGAMGIMQLMPATYAEMAVQYGLGADPHNSRDNILAGAAYLKWLKSKYGYPALFAELTERGWSDAELAGLGAGNVLRVLRDAERVAAAGR